MSEISVFPVALGAGGGGGAGDASEATLLLIKAKTDNLDVLLSTRTKPADTQKVDGSSVTQPVSGTFWQATQPVSGTFFQGTQPVSAASLPLPTGASTAAKQPALGVAGTPSADVISIQGIALMTALKVDGSGVTQPVSGTFWQATQPVSGTVTANAGTNLNTSNLALSATQTDRTQKTQITDGTRDGTVKAASTAPAATDTALVVTLNPNNAANSVAYKVDGSGVTQPVSGTFFQGTQPVSGTFWQATQPVSGTFWQATQPVSGTFFQATQPISATTLPLPTGASTAAKQPALGTAGTASADVISIQGIAGMTKIQVTPDSVALPLNQSVSVDQFAGVAISTGTGYASTGVPRVTISKDSFDESRRIDEMEQLQQYSQIMNSLDSRYGFELR